VYRTLQVFRRVKELKPVCDVVLFCFFSGDSELFEWDPMELELFKINAEKSDEHEG
jgi:hypothetical protein